MSNNIFQKLRFCILAACLLLSVNSALAQQNFTDFVVFGDSLSDTGNLASLSPVNLPFPFFENRITDGPVAIDYLSASIGKAAIASAEGGNNYSIAGGNLIGIDEEDIFQQISNYLDRVNGVVDDQVLHFFMIGGNDLRGLRSITNTEFANNNIAVAVDVLLDQLQRLHDAGARQFFVVNVANVGRIPETLQREAGDPGVGARATVYVKTYNQLLSAELSSFRKQTGDAVFEFDLFTELERLLNSPSSFGFTQTTVGCFDIGSFDFHPDCVFGLRFDRFVFFDNLHPASETNRLIGNAMVANLAAGPPTANGSAVPAILQLLLD